MSYTINNMDSESEWYKCSNESKLFLLCMKKPKVENKCKNLFDEWFKCMNTNPITLTQISKNQYAKNQYPTNENSKHK
jgi:hypothetical protein